MEEIRVENFAVASQSMTYSAYDSTERIASNSDFDDEQIRKMLASPLHIWIREESERQKSSSLLWMRILNDPVFLESRSFRKHNAMCVLKREANAKRHQAYHSRRGSLMTGLSRETGALGKLDAMFPCHDVFQIWRKSNCWEITSWWKQGSFA